MADKDVKKDIDAFWTFIGMHTKSITKLEATQKKLEERVKRLEKTVRQNEAMISLLEKRTKKK